MPSVDWVTFGFSVVCALFAGGFVAGGIAITFYVSVKVDAALTNKRLSDVEAAQDHQSDKADEFNVKLAELKDLMITKLNSVSQDVSVIKIELEKDRGDPSRRK